MVQKISNSNHVDGIEESVRKTLQKEISGEVRFDEITREIYSTDASIYRILPLCVTFPKNTNDVKNIVQIADENNIPILPRGGGSSLSGQTVNKAIVIDFSKYLNSVIDFDKNAKKIIAQPGISIDVLNSYLKPKNLLFTPDPSTTNRATVGGVIGNNSCGAHSVIYGKTIDHVSSLKTILSNGVAHKFEKLPFNKYESLLNKGSLESNIYGSSINLFKEYTDELKKRFPKIQRRVGGYNLDEINHDGYVDLTKLIVGSEGTLATITEAELDLVDLPTNKGLLVIEFSDIIKSMEASTYALEFEPSAVEHIGEIILDEAKKSPEFASGIDYLKNNPTDIIVAEFYGENELEVKDKIEKLNSKIQNSKLSLSSTIVMDPDQQSKVWNMRKAGLGLVMKKPGEAKAIPFVEDTAVSPEKLPEYVKRFDEIVRSNGTTAGYYGHASVGCLHIRPLINLKSENDIKKMVKISSDISDLVFEFGGAFSGEHGDGIVRGAWTKKMYGEKVYSAFKDLKKAFDPKNILNPGKIIETPPMDSNLRFGKSYKTEKIDTFLSFEKEGGFAQAIEMCNGQAACKKINSGYMCPSFMATRDEVDSTRGRANALRAALSGKLPIEKLNSKKLFNVLDLCLECKTCRSECPSGVDMAKIKYEFLHQYYKKNKIPLRSRLTGNISTLNKIGSIFPGIFNLTRKLFIFKLLSDYLLKIDKRRNIPKIAPNSFEKLYKSDSDSKEKIAVFFHDTFTNYNHPQVGLSAIKILKSLKYNVKLIDKKCCGRPLISKGLLGSAKKNAQYNIDKLYPLVKEGAIVIGAEPSCISALKDEYPDMFPRDERVNLISDNTYLLQEIITDPENLNKIKFKSNLANKSYAVQVHCHEKTISGENVSVDSLRLIPNSKVEKIPSGCCGMAGAFGYEKEHFDISKKIAEDRLIPYLSNIEKNTQVAITGVSCRHQIEDFSDHNPKHILEIIAENIET
ncbi:MAG: FAD-linked oxidase C-terminal domain-containing protein [Chloroflexota bacterium]|nr:FAD-linked oxidase C-terminal domain-containing protein [Chloroflexota bacterium]